MKYLRRANGALCRASRVRAIAVSYSLRPRRRELMLIATCSSLPMTPQTLDDASRRHMPRDVLVRRERRALVRGSSPATAIAPASTRERMSDDRAVVDGTDGLVIVGILPGDWSISRDFESGNLLKLPIASVETRARCKNSFFTETRKRESTVAERNLKMHNAAALVPLVLFRDRLLLPPASS